MQLKNHEIISILDAINEITDKDIPVEFAFKMIDISSKLETKYQSYIKTLQSIMKKANVEKPDDPAIIDQVKELLDISVEFNCELIDKKELIDTGIKLTLSQLVRLDKLIRSE